MLYLAQGSGTFESAHQGHRKISAGDCVILFPDEWHRYKPEQNTGWEEYWVTFQGRIARHWQEEGFIRSELPVLSCNRKGALSPLFEELLKLSAPDAPHGAYERAALCHSIIARAISLTIESNSAHPPRQHMRAAGDYLRMNAGKDVDLAMLAKRSGMSYSAFRRSFTKHFGMPPDRFHQLARVAQVKQFLIETELPLKKIAEEMNYSNEFYLMRVFKRHVGMTPTQWRRRRGVSGG